MANSFQALADPTRRRMVELLAERERPVGELVQAFDLTPPAISQHLKVLRQAGLVTVRVQGQQRIHRLNAAGLDEIEAWLVQTRRFWSQRLDALDQALREDTASRHPAHTEDPALPPNASSHPHP